jgi:hypothetical protein
MWAIEHKNRIRQNWGGDGAGQAGGGNHLHVPRRGRKKGFNLPAPF